MKNDKIENRLKNKTWCYNSIYLKKTVIRCIHTAFIWITFINNFPTSKIPPDFSGNGDRSTARLGTRLATFYIILYLIKKLYRLFHLHVLLYKV